MPAKLQRVFARRPSTRTRPWRALPSNGVQGQRPLSLPWDARIAYVSRMKNRPFLLCLLLLHVTVSTKALYDHGFFELYAFAMRDWPQFQILTDLTVAVVLLSVFVLRDARATGRKAWPYLVGALLLGSLSPLLYFVVGAFQSPTPSTPAAVA